MERNASSAWSKAPRPFTCLLNSKKCVIEVHDAGDDSVIFGVSTMANGCDYSMMRNTR